MYIPRLLRIPLRGDRLSISYFVHQEPLQLPHIFRIVPAFFRSGIPYLYGVLKEIP